MSDNIILEGQFIKAMQIASSGYVCSLRENGETINLELIKNTCESHIFNILFIKSCEVRGILPYKTDQYRRVSLTQIIDLIGDDVFNPYAEDSYNNTYLERKLQLIFKDTKEGRYTPNGTYLYDRIMNLYKTVYNGDFGFGIEEGFHESVFSSKEYQFAKSHKLNNFEVIKLLFYLNYVKEEKSYIKYQQIAFNYFTASQLGSIYESFLEYKLDIANEDMVFENNKWHTNVNLESEKVKNKIKTKNIQFVRSGETFFTPDNKNRKDTGSYYTPDYIVKYIVSETLSPLIKGKTSKDILNLKVCDPAIGSGRFLSGALEFLTNAYIDAVNKEKYDDVDFYTPSVKRKVLDSCIFGVDINPRAVKLAKMSLWLDTAIHNVKLKRLDDQLKCGNSLIDANFNWETEFKKHGIMQNGGFDAVIGNPPYFALNSEYKEILSSNYKDIYAGNSDIYYYFMRRGCGLLKNGCSMGLIVSRSFLEAQFAKNLREYLTTKTLISKIVDFQNYYIFKDVGITTAIVVLLKGENCKGNKLKYLKCLSDNKRTINSIEEFEFVESVVEQTAMLQNDGKWKTSESNPLFLNSVRLEEICTVVKSMETGKNSVFVITSDIIKQFCIEKSLLKPLAKSGSIKAFGNKKLDKQLLWTHGIDLNEYPNTRKYLSKYREELENRYDIQSRSAPWYEPSNPRSADLFASNRVKILVPYISDVNNFFVDELGHYNDGGDIRAIFLHDDCPYSPYFLTAVLNSKLLNTHHHCIAKLKSNKMYEYYNSVLNGLPIPPLNLKIREHKRLYEQIIELSQAAHRFFKEENWKEVGKLKQTIDELVELAFSLAVYGLKS